MRRCAVIGSPISHSLSPALHQAGYEWLGLDWVYERHEVTPDTLNGFIAGLGDEWRGLSVTMPCKKAIVHLGIPDEVVTALGVGNTVIFDGHPQDRTTTRIHNSDVSGVRTVLGGMDPCSEVLVYGNGATARSCVYALSGLGVPRVQVKARNQDATHDLAADAARWGIEVVPPGPRADVLVSTVPADVAADWGIGSASEVFDVLYDPWPTPLVTQARAAGLTTATGLDLLAAQAVGQMELMTGSHVDFSVLRSAADQSMARLK